MKQGLVNNTLWMACKYLTLYHFAIFINVAIVYYGGCFLWVTYNHYLTQIQMEGPWPFYMVICGMNAWYSVNSNKNYTLYKSIQDSLK